MTSRALEVSNRERVIAGLTGLSTAVTAIAPLGVIAMVIVLVVSLNSGGTIGFFGEPSRTGTDGWAPVAYVAIPAGVVAIDVLGGYVAYRLALRWARYGAPLLTGAGPLMVTVWALIFNWSGWL